MRDMCGVATQLLDANEGIALAAAERFVEVGQRARSPPSRTRAARTASGATPSTPPPQGWCGSSPTKWPPDVRAALAHAAAPRAERAHSHGTPACSMPLAELFGPWAMAAAVAEGVGDDGLRPWQPCPASAVISVVDCAPAAAVLSSAPQRSDAAPT